MVVIILVLCILICVLSVIRLKGNGKKADEWNKIGVNMGKKANAEDVLVLLSNLKLPEDKTVKRSENNEIIVEVNKIPFKVIMQENQAGDTIIKFQQEGKNNANAIETTWLYEFFNDEVKHTNNAMKFYKKSNSNARKILFAGVGIIICIIILLTGPSGEKKRLMNASPDAYPDITYKEAFEGYFTGHLLDKPEWFLLEDDNGNKTLEFHGSLPAAGTKLEVLPCEEINIIFDIDDDRMTLNDVVIYGDLESITVPYKREMSAIMDFYVIEFLFEYAKGLKDGEPSDPLGYAFVKLVQGGSLANYPEHQLGTAFENAFIDKCEWEYFLSDSGKDIVEFNGAIDDTTYKMQFIVNEDCEHFSLEYMDVNGEAMPEYLREIMLAAVFMVDDVANVSNGEEPYYDSEMDNYYTAEDELEWIEGDGFDDPALLEILDEKKQLYGEVQFVLMDIGTDGCSELIVSYGEIEADKVTDFYVYDSMNAAYYYSDSVPGTSVMYMQEDGDGIIAVQGSQGCEWIYYIWEENGMVGINLTSERELTPDEEYYSNPNPIVFTPY